MEVVTAVCTGCEAERLLQDFSRDARGKNGRQTTCKLCQRKKNRAWYAKNRDTKLVKDRARIRLNRGGFTPEMVARLFSEQDGKRAICGDVLVESVPVETERNRVMVADHNHKTGEPRGLICPPCNFGLGRFRDSPERLRAAAEYLERYGCD